MSNETSTSKILDEVNELNTPVKNLSELNVSLANPVAVEGEEHNTRLFIQATPGKGFTDEVEIFYKRLDLAVVLAAADVRSTDPFTPESVVTLVNGQFGLFLTVDDLEPFTPPELNVGETATLTLTSKPTSRGFIGTVDIEIKYGKTLLESVIAIRVLPVLKHPDPLTTGKESARMLTFGLDFTSVRDAIAVNPLTGSYVDWDKLQICAAMYGIPSWGVGQIVHKATSEVPDSNTAFDRVVVQQDISSDRMVGPVYLHYNLLDGAN